MCPVSQALVLETILPEYCPLALLLIVSGIPYRELVYEMKSQGDPCRYNIVLTASVLLAAVIRGRWWGSPHLATPD